MKQAKIKSLWRYPTKSLLGESLQTVELDGRGIIGDRIYAVSDSQGKLGSTKNTKRFRRIDGLFSLASKTTENGIQIVFPDGDVLHGHDQAIDRKLSNQLGKEVSLTRESSISHFDDGAVHIISTAELAKLRLMLPDSSIDERRFRANILVDCDLCDNELLGKTLTIGDVKLKIMHKTERCRTVSMAQGSLDSDARILKTVVQRFSLNFGIYASIITEGCISVNDPIEIA